MSERANTLFNAFLVGMNDQLHTNFFRHLVAELNHLPELPGGIHVHQWEWRLAWVESLTRKMQHHRRVFTDGVKHYGVIEFGSHFADDMHTLRF